MSRKYNAADPNVQKQEQDVKLLLHHVDRWIECVFAVI